MGRSIGTLLLLGWLLTSCFSIPLILRPSGLVVAGNLQKLTFRGSPFSHRIIFSTYVCDLGVTLELTFSHHVQYFVVRNCYYQLRRVLRSAAKGELLVHRVHVGM